jgi:hypothetical protein
VSVAVTITHHIIVEDDTPVLNLDAYVFALPQRPQGQDGLRAQASSSVAADRLGLSG